MSPYALGVDLELIEVPLSTRLEALGEHTLVVLEGRTVVLHRYKKGGACYGSYTRRLRDGDLEVVRNGGAIHEIGAHAQSDSLGTAMARMVDR